MNRVICSIILSLLMASSWPLKAESPAENKRTTFHSTEKGRPNMKAGQVSHPGKTISHRPSKSGMKVGADLTPQQQTDFKLSVADIQVAQKTFFSLTSGERGYDIENGFAPGGFFQAILKPCADACVGNEAFCGALPNCTGANDVCTGMLIPANRKSFIYCMKEGIYKTAVKTQDTIDNGVCATSCTGSWLGNSCADTDTRRACKVLCCGAYPGGLVHCLSKNNDSCDNYN